jgi:hypothetical protein
MMMYQEAVAGFDFSIDDLQADGPTNEGNFKPLVIPGNFDRESQGLQTSLYRYHMNLAGYRSRQGVGNAGAIGHRAAGTDADKTYKAQKSKRKCSASLRIVTPATSSLRNVHVENGLLVRSPICLTQR